MKICPDAALLVLILERVKLTQWLQRSRKRAKRVKLRKRIRAIDKAIGERCQDIFTP